MAALQPGIAQHLIPVASDWKSTDWLMANCQIQEQFLLNSKQPVHDARMHAMLCYRTPASFNQRFNRSTNEDLQVFNVESWLTHHGEKLQSRFQLAAYKLVNQLLRSIDITRNGPEAFKKLQESDTHIHIIGVDSDLFFTAIENKETFKQLAQSRSNVTYGEIRSVHGHDAFLLEFDQLQELLAGIFSPIAAQKKVQVLKFGGKSLANGEGIEKVCEIIAQKQLAQQPIVVVASARDKATDQLATLLDLAAAGSDYESLFSTFKSQQLQPLQDPILETEFEQLSQILSGVSLIKDYSLKTKDQVLAFGELLSVKTLVTLLNSQGVKAQFLDSRSLLRTNDDFGNAQVQEVLSKQQVKNAIEGIPKGVVPVITGFIGGTEKGETTTLGRNGSNYSAALIASFLDAGELQNFTHVDGIYTADPTLVPAAQKIAALSYSEANELANFGATILHAKTIIPLLEKNIPLRILNTFKAENEGTLISATPTKEGIKSLSVIEAVSLINIEGRGLLGKAGVDARIFKALAQVGISVSIISQGSSERGIGLVVADKDATKAIISLEQEFEQDFYAQDVNRIYAVDQVSVISIVGQDLSTFHKPYNALITNQIVPLLFNNTVTGKNVSLIVEKKDLIKAVNVIHAQIFGQSKKVNIAIFGVGQVGGVLVDQILKAAPQIAKRKGIQLQIFALANSSKMLLEAAGIGQPGTDWRQDLAQEGVVQDVGGLFEYAQSQHLENLIVVDNTASTDFVAHYPSFVAQGFDLVSSNKIANTLSYGSYAALRQQLSKFQKQYLYETNVGAGLPLIDTIKLLHLSGENITQIRGVFSGSLSYIFNRFSENDLSFSSVVNSALEQGFTEPDPREDLSGNDVGRKLLILARELDLKNEFSDILIDNLIPKELAALDQKAFLGQMSKLDTIFAQKKAQLAPGQVLRYVGVLDGDLQQEKGQLGAQLIAVDRLSPMGQLKGSDSIVEIYTESYGDQPIVIQGAGAGAAVTARGVFGDILRIVEKN
jgi:aspartate kinase